MVKLKENREIIMRNNLFHMDTYSINNNNPIIPNTHAFFGKEKKKRTNDDFIEIINMVRDELTLPMRVEYIQFTRNHSKVMDGQRLDLMSVNFHLARWQKKKHKKKKKLGIFHLLSGPAT